MTPAFPKASETYSDDFHEDEFDVFTAHASAIRINSRKASEAPVSISVKEAVSP
jgi:hypothetical protein